MLVLSNREVFVLADIAPGGVYAHAIWLKHKNLAGTSQELWNRLENTVYGQFKIPVKTAQIHTDIFIPYVATVEAKTAIPQS